MREEVKKLNEKISKLIENNFDEPIEDEYEALRKLLFDYGDTETSWEDGYITNLDLEQFDSDNWLPGYSNEDYVIVAREEGYPVIELNNVVYIGDPDLSEDELYAIVNKNINESEKSFKIGDRVLVPGNKYYRRSGTIVKKIGKSDVYEVEEDEVPSRGYPARTDRYYASELDLLDNNIDESLNEEKETDSFFKKLEDEFTVEDFTGHLGVILADESDFTDEEEYVANKEEALKFIQKLYDFAVEYIR